MKELWKKSTRNFLELEAQKEINSKLATESTGNFNTCFLFGTENETKRQTVLAKFSSGNMYVHGPENHKGDNQEYFT